MKHDKIVKVINAHPHHHIEVELGDSKQPDVFYPQFKTKHWDNEVNFSVRLKDDDHAGAHVHHDGKTTHWKRGGRTARFYQKDTDDENGGFEFEVEIDKKPESNVLEFSVQSKGLDFFYQPHEIDQKDLDMGAQPRAEHVKGSYAVYHKEKMGDYSQVGGKNYKSGKAFHIYRPYVVDANGKQEWCELHIDDAAENLTITIPQSFLDTAMYPIIVDPTFGYTTNGASGDFNNNNYLFGSYFACPESGTGVSMTGVIQTNGTGQSYYWAMYDNAGNLAGYSGSNSMIDAAGAYWKTNNFTAGHIPALTAQTYWLGITTFTTAITFLHYDVGAANQGAYHFVGAYQAPAATLGSVTLQTWKRTVYATYNTITPQINVSDTITTSDLATDVIRGDQRDVSVYDNVWIPYGETANHYSTDSTFVGSSFSRGPYNDLATTLNYGGWGDWYYSFLHFDTQHAPPSAQVQSAVFWAYNNSGTTNDALNQLVRNTSAWDAHLESYDLLLAGTPTRSLTPEGNFPSSTIAGWHSVDMTALYKAWLDGSQVNYGFRIRAQSNNNTAGTYSSKWGANPPYIAVTLVPETVDQTVDNTRTLNLFDSSTMTESNTQNAGTLSVSVFDASTITEAVTITNPSVNINVFDTSTLDDTTGLSLANAIPGISVGEDIVITENLAMASGPQVNDAIAISESVTAFIPDFPISVSDTITLTESVVNSGSLGVVSISDTITITEAVSPLNIYGVSVADTITFTESTTPMLDLYLISGIYDVVYVIGSQLSQPFNNNFHAPVWGTGGNYEMVAQSFVATGTSINQIALRLAKVGSPTDTFNVDIVATLDGTSLHNSNVAESTVVSGNWLTWTFGVPLAVTDGATYQIQLSRTGVRDVSNYVGPYLNVGNNAGTIQNGDVYPYGTTKLKTSGSWASQPTWDITFNVNYGGLEQELVFQPNLPLSVYDTMYVDEGGLSSWNLTATQDSYASGNNPGPNYTSPTFYTGKTAAGVYSYSYFKFDVSTVHGSLNNARFIVNTLTSPATSPQNQIHAISVPWDQTTLTNANQPGYDGTWTDNYSPAWDTSIGAKTVDITNIIAAMVGGYTNNGIGMYSQFSAADSTTQFASSKNADASLVPRLMINSTVGAQITSAVSVSDTLTLTENVAAQGILPTSTFDAITITESTAVQIVSSVSVSDTLTITETVAALNIFYVSVSDTLTMTESVTPLSILNINVFDAISVLETVTAVGGGESVSVFDAITITESASVTTTQGESGSDVITITEQVTALTSGGVASVSDTITISEAVTLLSLFFVNVFDSSTISESTTVSETGGVTSVFDSLTISENVVTAVQDAESGSDTITLTELVTAVTSGSNISTSDQLTITENAPAQLISFVSVFDLITSSESTTASESGGVTSVFDALTMSESTAISLSQSGSESDVITILEQVTLAVSLANIIVSDSVGITENVAVTEAVGVNVSDTVTFVEVVSNGQSSSIYVIDTITAAESIATQGLAYINVQDTIVLGDTGGAINPTVHINVYDQSSMTEFVSTVGELVLISLSDSLTISESKTVASPGGSINVYDSIAISETTFGEPFIGVSLYDSMSITENLISISHVFSPQDINKIPRGYGMAGSTIVRTMLYGGIIR